MKKTFLHNPFFIIILGVNLLLLIFYPAIGKKSLALSWNNLPNIIFMLIPIFIFMGLLDVWVPKETMIRIMGEYSKGRGVLIALLLGAITAVPLYGLLPMTGILLKKGCKLSNILIFLCSSASLRIPLFLFEVSSLGWRFALIQFLVSVIAVLLIAFLVEKILSQKEKKEIYENANTV
jgi:uncharacterized membrane protein YraQ (UPF0718 family)